MENGAVAIKAIARESGVRSKIAVASSVPGVDPVGTFVGGHGTRVNAVMSEVGEQEKIDIVVWDEDPVAYITNALSPTKVDHVKLNEKDKKAEVKVAEDQLSIAIGKSGQNVRLASKLAGYEIDMVSDEPRRPKEEKPKEEQKPAEAPKKIGGQLKKKEQLESSLLSAIEEHGEESEKPAEKSEDK
jgi:N utilization substance protein A